MKTRLNILSILILFVFGISFGYELSLGLENFKDGWGDSRGKQERTEKHYQDYVSLRTTEPIVIDSLYNALTDQWVPVKVKDAEFIFEKERKYMQLFPTLIYVLSTLIGIPILVISFLKLMASIKKGIIFDRKNISRLRLIGSIFLLIGIVFSLWNFITYAGYSSLLENTQYHIDKRDWISFSNLIFGLISFLSSEILAIGLKMQEEQDLTI